MRILVTHIKVCSNLKLLSGVILDGISAAGLPKDVFSAFLVSNRALEVRCERPKYIGGLGVDRKGRTIVEFETNLFGKTSYVEDQSSNNLVEVAENRVVFAIDSGLQDLEFPALLSAENPTAPVKKEALVSLRPRTLGDLPDVRAFIQKESYLLGSADTQQKVSKGMMLPVCYLSSNSMAGLYLKNPIKENSFHAYIYHEHNVPAPVPGDILTRRVSTADEREEQHVFESIIGNVDEI